MSDTEFWERYSFPATAVVVALSSAWASWALGYLLYRATF